MGELLFLERLAWMDAQIRAGKFPNARKMAEKFEISQKTAQRTIDWIRDRFGAPLEYVPHKKGYRYEEDFALPVTGLTSVELTNLLAIQKLLEDASHGALGKELAKIVGKVQKVLAERFFNSVDPRKAFSLRWTNVAPCDEETFQSVLKAVILRRRLIFDYTSPYGNEKTTRTVEPHHMVNYQGTWHILAWCLLREDWRDFVLARMQRCVVSVESFVPRDFREWQERLETSFGIFRGRERFHVTLRFDVSLARWARDQYWHQDQSVKILDTGEVEVTFPATHETEVLAESLRYGSHVELVAPSWFRKKLRNELRAMLNIYSQDKDT
ncbi:MAG: WYL domain-containing protein [Desulfosoma sp.]